MGEQPATWPQVYYSGGETFRDRVSKLWPKPTYWSQCANNAIKPEYLIAMLKLRQVWLLMTPPGATAPFQACTWPLPALLSNAQLLGRLDSHANREGSECPLQHICPGFAITNLLHYSVIILERVMFCPYWEETALVADGLPCVQCFCQNCSSDNHCMLISFLSLWQNTWDNWLI